MIIAEGSTMIVGTAILASSTTVAQLLVGRIVTGIVSMKYHPRNRSLASQGNGFNSSNILAYQSEHCDARKRGRLLSLQGTITIIGLCIAYWMDFGLR